MLALFATTVQISAQRLAMLRQYDDFSAFDSIANKTTYQQIKTIKPAKDSRLMFGGNVRIRGEAFIHPDYKDQEPDELYNINRLLLHADYRFSRGQAFAQLMSSSIFGKEKPSPVEKDELAVVQMFVDYKLDENWTASVGRKLMSFGNGRILDMREGPNVLESFDQAAVHYQNPNHKVSAFYATHVDNKPYVFDNKFLEFDETVAGVYTENQLSKNWKVDLYALHFRKENVRYFNAGSATDSKFILGGRYYGRTGNFSMDAEAYYTPGTFGDYKINGFGINLQPEIASRLGNVSWNNGIKANLYSGDKNPNDKVIGNFASYYNRIGYIGEVGIFAMSNLYMLHPYTQFNFSDKLKLTLDYAAFWRYSTSDGLYAPGIIPVFPSVNSNRFAAQQLGATFVYQPTRYLQIKVDHNTVFPGPFLSAQGMDDTMYYFRFGAEYKF